MFFEDDYVSCKECGYRQFKAEQVFMIKKVVANTPRKEISYVREANEIIKCCKCGSILDLE
jgi:DNA-directed RNA polymerase subunit RPC12/RpoP